MTKNDNILKEILRQDVSRPNSVFSGDNTYTTLFLMPAIDVYVENPYYKHFINAYIEDAGLKHYFKRPIFILIKYGGYNEVLRAFIKYLTSKKDFVYTYLAGIQDKELLRMFVFECPVKYKTDYDHFLKGQYSQFSSEYKAKFTQTIRTVTGQAIESPLYGVVYKTPTLKKKVEGFIGESLSKNQEYFGILKPEFEIFRYKKELKTNEDDNH